MKFAILDTYIFTIPLHDEIREDYEEMFAELSQDYNFYVIKEAINGDMQYTIPTQNLTMDEYEANGMLWRLLYFFKLKTNYLFLGGDGCVPTFGLELEYVE